MLFRSLTARGFPLFYGALGENLTTEGLDRRALRAGQRYRIGSEVVVELTKSRAPCKTLDMYGTSLQSAIYDKGVKERNATSPFWGMSGFYASVVQGGVVRPGAPIIFVSEMA